MMISRKWLGVWGTLGSLVLVNCTAPTDTNPGTSGGPGGSGEGNTGNTTGQGGDTQTGSGGNTSGQGGNMPSGSGGAGGGAGGDKGSTSGSGGNGTGGGGNGGGTTTGGGGSGNGSGSGGAGGNGTGGAGTGGAGTGGAGTGGAGAGGAGAGGAGTGGGGGGPTGCTDVATLVYVLSADNDLYSFDPPARAFTRIGTINCNTTLTPNSMAIDRSGRAWVNYFDSFGLGQGEIWKVNVRDASCEAAPTVILPPDWAQVGMGFAVDFTRMGDDTLFIDSLSGNGLAKIDANMVVPIADFTPATFSGSVAELTGTGDGRLYGYFQTSPVYVAQINKSTAAVTNPVAITGLNTPDAYAFSFWGGSFYLYAASIGSNSRVTKYDPATGVINNNYILDTGMQIVGAGVSTCAPVQPPNN